MMIEAIAPLSNIVFPEKVLSSESIPTSGSNFGDWFTTELNSVNDRIVGSENDAQKLAVGETQNLHEVMIHMEEARLSFQMLVQVRNKLLEAYQEVMRMQV